MDRDNWESGGEDQQSPAGSVNGWAGSSASPAGSSVTLLI